MQIIDDKVPNDSHIDFSQEFEINELKKMVEFRTKFHNMIVHDLRAPSTSI